MSFEKAIWIEAILLLRFYTLHFSVLRFFGAYQTKKSGRYVSWLVIHSALFREKRNRSSGKALTIAQH